MTSKLRDSRTRIRPRQSRVRLEGNLAIRTAGLFGLEVSYGGELLDEETLNLSQEEVMEERYQTGRVHLDAPSDLELRVRAEDYAVSEVQTEDEARAWLEGHHLDEESLVIVYPTGLVVADDTDEVLREGQDQLDEEVWSWALERKTGDAVDDERQGPGRHPSM